MGIEILGGLEIHQILTKLGPKETAIVGCVSRHFRDRASDDYLWSQFCAQELHLYSPEDPLGNLIPSFKVLCFTVFLCIIYLLDFLCMYCLMSTNITYMEVVGDKTRFSSSIEIDEPENI